jgi:hypothetical protein
MMTSLLQTQAKETRTASMGVQLIHILAEAQSNSSRSPSWIPGAISGKINAENP